MSVTGQRIDLGPLTARGQASFAQRARWGVPEISFWLIVVASVFLLPSKHLILTEIAILALFALSLDLILGYAGIVSLGHAAFFGCGAYVAGILAKYGIVKEPVLALLVSGFAAAMVGFVTSFLMLRGSDLTRLMVTLGVALVLREIANRLDITGGADGLQGVVMEPVLGHFAFDIFGKTAYIYSLIVLFILFVLARRIVNSPFGLSLRSVHDNPLRASAIGIHVNGRLVAVYTVAAGYAGIAGALLTQSTQFASLSVLDFERSDIRRTVVLAHMLRDYVRAAREHPAASGRVAAFGGVQPSRGHAADVDREGRSDICDPRGFTSLGDQRVGTWTGGLRRRFLARRA